MSRGFIGCTSSVFDTTFSASMAEGVRAVGGFVKEQRKANSLSQSYVPPPAPAPISGASALYYDKKFEDMQRERDKFSAESRKLFLDTLAREKKWNDEVDKHLHRPFNS